MLFFVLQTSKGDCGRQSDRQMSLTWNRIITVVSTHLISLLHRSRGDLPLFQVGLSIDIGSLNVTHSMGVARVKQKNVCWNDLITRELNKVTQTYLLPLLTHKCFCFPNKKEGRGGDIRFKCNASIDYEARHCLLLVKLRSLACLVNWSTLWMWSI